MFVGTVVEVLGTWGDQMPIDRLLPLLEDPSSGVRQAVVQVLGRWEIRCRLTAYSLCLRTLPPMFVGGGRSPGHPGDQMPLDRLLPLLEDPDADVRQGVVEILGSLGDQMPLLIVYFLCLRTLTLMFVRAWFRSWAAWGIRCPLTACSLCWKILLLMFVRWW